MMDLVTLTALLRGLHLAASLSLLGVVGFIAWILPAAAAEAQDVLAPLTTLWRISGVATLVTLAAWFVSQAAVIAGASTLPQAVAALPLVAEHTRYGAVVLARSGLLLVATLLSGSSRIRLYPAMAVAAVALGLQGLTGHAGAMGGAKGDGLVVSEALHLLAAGLWLGALAPLWLTLARLPARAGQAVCERFSPIGLACVLVIAGSGVAQAMALIGSLPALVGTRYGHIALLKITLFLAALALATFNRLGLTDRLSHVETGASTRLRRSIACETLIGLAIIVAAAFLASCVPAEHEPPVWPFPWRFSLVSVTEDSDFRQEVIISLMLLVGAILLVVAACLRRRRRVIALAVLAGTAIWRGPSLALLTVEAYPTSFQTSPTGFSAASIVRGQVLFGRHCVACHGADGDGNGPLAGGLRLKPADLTMPHVWDHADGTLFWWLTHGIDDPDGGLAMPGFAQLPPTDRWALIDYVRAHNAALALRADRSLDTPVAAPALALHCANGDAARLADLRGRVVHVVMDGGTSDPIPPQRGIPVVALELRSDGAEAGVPMAGACTADAPAAQSAFAVLANVPPDRLPGVEFLIDANGWLRAIHIPGDAGGWDTRDALIAAIRGICGDPVPQRSGDEHEHHR